MRNILMIVFVLMPFVLFAQQEINQTDSSGLKQGHWKKLQDNGRVLYEGSFVNDKPVGEFRRYHSSGHLNAIFNYVEGTDSASVKLYDERGKQIASGQYVNQQKEGKWLSFEDGVVIAEDYYKNDKKHGESRTFYTGTGELYEETDWINGEETGVYRSYFRSGKTNFECQMKNGLRDGYCQSFYENGRVEMEGFYTLGIPDNEWTYYDEEGKLIYTLEYKKGRLMNPEVRDSIQTLQLNELEKNKGKIPDPENYLHDPSEYMMQMNIR